VNPTDLQAGSDTLAAADVGAGPDTMPAYTMDPVNALDPMTPQIHDKAIAHLPFFITPPGHTDILFWGMAGFVLLIIVLLGALYLTLHSIPERMSHKKNKVQLQLVSVLALIGLFTHNNALWMIALLLALVELPDFRTPTIAIADSLDRIARRLERRPPPPARDEQTFAEDAAADHEVAVVPEVEVAPPKAIIAAKQKKAAHG